MIKWIEIRESALHLLFPRVCGGCGGDLSGSDSALCLQCLNDLPQTHFEKFADNPVEKIFWGRIPVKAASAQFYFSKMSLIQQLMHLFKYRGDREIGLQLGRLMGEQIRSGGRFDTDALIPLPLNEKRERQRGFNQAAILCEGMSEVLNLPVLRGAVTRPSYTETQTRKGRIARWKNIEGRFRVEDPKQIEGRHLMLVDDVVTTGATLESCGAEILKLKDTRISIVTLCFAAH